MKKLQYCFIGFKGTPHTSQTIIRHNSEPILLDKGSKRMAGFFGIYRPRMIYMVVS